jgi:energy-converting hydrogenase Eha subunit F
VVGRFAKAIGEWLQAIIQRLRRVVTIWRLLLVVVGFMAALNYDQYRNKPKPAPKQFDFTGRTPRAFLRIRNPLELKNPATTKLGQIEKQVSATQLYEDFQHDEQKGRTEYLGKTYLIEGAVVELFDLETSNLRDEFAMSRPPLLNESVTVGMMLLPEIPKTLQTVGVENTASVHPVSISAHFEPFVYEARYRDLLLARDPNFDLDKAHEFVYWWYSDDVSFLSHVGGVYCMFARPHSTTPYLRNEPARKRITAECKIIDYKAGGVENIESYKVGYKEPTKRRTKPRVLAAGCIEINYELDK